MKTFNYIYKITNEINGKIYIGKHSTDNLNDGYMGSGVVLKQAIKKYGVENFTKDILEFCDKEVELNDLEKHYIDKYKSTDKSIGYNLTSGGDGKSDYICSYETINKLSESHKGKKPWNKGKKLSEEHIIKLCEAHKGKNHPMYGKHHSDEVRKKMSESNKGKEPWNKGKKGLQIAWNKGKNLNKPKWLTPDGEIKEMSITNKKRWHPDWIEYNKYI